MIKRPSKADNENEILRMQQEFYAEQNRDVNFQPAAKVVRVQRDVDGAEKRASSPSGKSGTGRQSEFAKRRAERLRSQADAEAAQKEAGVEIGDESEPPLPEEPPKELPIMGDVVERHPVVKQFAKVPPKMDGSFPKTMHITAYPTQSRSDGPKKSLFAQMVMKGKEDGKPNERTAKKEESIEFEEQTGSTLLEGWDAIEIHNENLRKLHQMSVDEIQKEQDHLLSTLDPTLVEFLKSRKHPTNANVKRLPDESKSLDGKTLPQPQLLPVGMEVLKEKGSEQWINFDVLEPEKLEWTKDIERSVKELKPGETYEARFDWKGILQQYASEPHDQPADDRELYLHGEDAQRPGYTLQELFRLARSNVLQQRIAALAAIAGMLNIMNQGFYDGILELPVSKVFFFLRFALDENTPSVVEVASRALASLFYNDTDEILLDTVFDTEYGMVQPEMGLNITHSHEEEQRQRELQMRTGFEGMNLSGSGMTARPPSKARFKANLPDPDDPDDVHNRETMNDFHLAETDLVECLLRTNIVERIRYILFVMNPEGATVINCAKILIRLARTSERMATKIATNEPLLGGLVKHYLTSIDGTTEGDHQPQSLVLKLLRILCAYRTNFYEQHMQRFHVINLVKRYIHSRKDIDVKMIQIQIEAFRFFRLLLQSKPDAELYGELWPALHYLLEWHYQHLIFAEDGPFIIRQHAVALLALIGPGLLQRDATAPGTPGHPDRHRALCDRLFDCCSKWFTAAHGNGANEFSQKLLLAGCLWAAAKARPVVGEMTSFRTFLDRYLIPFVRGVRFGEIIQTLSSTSLLLTVVEDRTPYVIGSLPTLGAVQLRRNQTVPTLIVTSTYPVLLLHALLHLVPIEERTLRRELFGHRAHRHYFDALCARSRTQVVQSSSNANCLLGGNWFTQTIELRYLLDVLTLMVHEMRHAEPSDGMAEEVRTVALPLAFIVTFTLSEMFYPALVKLFDDIVFVPGFYGTVGVDLGVTGADMQRWKLNFKLLAQRAVQAEVNLDAERKDAFTVTEWKNVPLARCWPYSPLYLMVDKLEKGSPKLEALSESSIIDTGLRFSELVERMGITIGNPTVRLMYLMAAFLGPDSKFLEPHLAPIIERRIVGLRDEMAEGGGRFDFETTKIASRKSFYGLYQLALDVFQSSSYGHAGFGCLLMAPLAQRYDVRWRNMVWSEYVAVLRFITCGERELFGSLDTYLHPAEEDNVLLRSYGQALNSNLLRPGSIPHRVANHHVQVYRSKAKVMPTTDGKLPERSDAAG